MSTGVERPTLWVGLGAFGREVMARAASSLPSGPAAPCEVLTTDDPDLAGQAAPLLESLLHVSRLPKGNTGPRLDIVLACSAIGGEPDTLLRACDSLSRLVREGYASLFSASLPFDQRAAALHLLVRVPPLASPGGQEALSRLGRLEAWAEEAPFPLLSRAWVFSQQTTAGTLRPEDVTGSVAAFGVAAFASGMRDQELVATRLRHPAPGEPRLCMASVASAELPENTLYAYARARAVYEGLSVLAARTAQGNVDPARVSGMASGLAAGAWGSSLAPGGSADRAARAEARQLAQVPDLPPMGVEGAGFDAVEVLRERLAPLLAPPRPLSSASPSYRQHLAALQRTLDHAEADELGKLERAVDGLFDGPLAREGGLEPLPAVEQALEQVAQGLARREQVLAAGALAAEQGEDVSDEGREALEQALSELPSRGALWAPSAAVGTAAGWAAAAWTLWLRMPSAAPAGAGAALPTLKLGTAAAATAPSFPWGEALPWAVGLLSAGLAGWGWAWFSSREARARLKAAVRERRDVLESIGLEGGGGPTRKLLERQLWLRQRRVLRGAARAVASARERLGAVRRALEEARQASRQALVGLKVQLGPEAAADDLSTLLNASSTLHPPLLPPAAVAQWVSRAREVTEPRVWADRVLEAGWPTHGLREDAPCMDGAVLETLAERQVAPLRTRSLFDDVEARAGVVEAARRMGPGLASGLAPACTPRDGHGDPAHGLRAGEGFVLAPLSGREALEEVLSELPLRLQLAWSDSPALRVVFVRTWEGFTVAELRNGVKA
ncbi:MAG: hypothetical protein RL653_2821 [Pseudomonadota bacterium]|jgi:hypothetical protein